jgi:hypothetical protein
LQLSQPSRLIKSSMYVHWLATRCPRTATKPGRLPTHSSCQVKPPCQSSIDCHLQATRIMMGGAGSPRSRALSPRSRAGCDSPSRLAAGAGSTRWAAAAQAHMGAAGRRARIQRHDIAPRSLIASTGHRSPQQLPRS